MSEKSISICNRNILKENQTLQILKKVKKKYEIGPILSNLKAYLSFTQFPYEVRRR